MRKVSGTFRFPEDLGTFRFPEDLPVFLLFGA